MALDGDASKDAILQVYELGELTVVGFGGNEFLDQLDLTDCRNQITKLVQENNVKTLAFDLMGIRIVPSGFLGLIASLRELDVKVQVYNPSPDVREVLEVTKIDQLVEVHDVKR